jgi:uncharacterized membrane protein required for colicin V production
MLDLAVVVIVAVSAFAGWRKGFLTPLFAIGLSLLGLYAIYNGPAAGAMPTGTAGLGLGVVAVGVASSFVMRIGGVLTSLVHRVKLLNAGDHVLGLPLGAATGLVAVYLGLVAVVSFDNMLAPFHGKPSVDQAAVAAMRAAVAANPQFSVMLDPGMLDAMAKQVAKSAIPADQLATFDQSLAFYEGTARPALLASVSAQIILGLGEHLPFLGRHVDFPMK